MRYPDGAVSLDIPHAGVSRPDVSRSNLSDCVFKFRFSSIDRNMYTTQFDIFNTILLDSFELILDSVAQ